MVAYMHHNSKTSENAVKKGITEITRTEGIIKVKISDIENKIKNKTSNRIVREEESHFWNQC